MEHVSAVYAIVNQTNGKHYVGSAVDCLARERDHLGKLRRGQHVNRHLQAAFDKYGEQTFQFIILQEADEPQNLIPLEQHYIDRLKPEYNILPIAGSHLGACRTAETRRNMSAAHTGKPATRQGAQTPEHVRRKMSMVHKGKPGTRFGPHSPETRRKMSEWQLGKHVSTETRMKIAEGSRKAHQLRVQNHPEMETERRRKISATLLGLHELKRQIRA